MPQNHTIAGDAYWSCRLAPYGLVVASAVTEDGEILLWGGLNSVFHLRKGEKIDGTFDEQHLAFKPDGSDDLSATLIKEHDGRSLEVGQSDAPVCGRSKSQPEGIVRIR